MRKVSRPVADLTRERMLGEATLFCDEVKRRRGMTPEFVRDWFTKIISCDRMEQETGPDYEWALHRSTLEE